MTGWPAVATTTGLMVIALTGFNVRLYRRMKAATKVSRRECDGALMDEPRSY